MGSAAFHELEFGREVVRKTINQQRAACSGQLRDAYKGMKALILGETTN